MKNCDVTAGCVNALAHMFNLYLCGTLLCDSRLAPLRAFGGRRWLVSCATSAGHGIALMVKTNIMVLTLPSRKIAAPARDTILCTRSKHSVVHCFTRICAASRTKGVGEATYNCWLFSRMGWQILFEARQPPAPPVDPIVATLVG